MSEIPGEQRPGAVDPAGQQQDVQDELKDWLEWGKQAAETGKDFAALGWAELRLAMGDAKRIAILGLAMLPLALLAWIGLSVLLGWLAYVPSDSVAVGLAVFLAVQVIPILIMLMMIKGYSKSLSLPATKKHMQAFKEAFRDGAKGQS
jgi:hypothetical protein